MSRAIKMLAAALLVSAAATTAFAETAATAPAKPAATAHTGAMHAGAKARGPSHQLIQDAQTALDKNGAKLDVDGRLGPKTRAALVSFQKDHGLKPTGTLNHATIQALNLPHRA